MKVTVRVVAVLCCFAAMAVCVGCASDSEAVRTEKAVLPVENALVNEHSSEPVGGGSGTLTLDRAVDEALAASPELEQIRQRIDAATEQIRQVEASFYPRVVLAEEFNRTDNAVLAFMDILNQRRLRLNTDFNHPGVQQDAASQVQAEWAFFEGGSSWYKRKAALGQRRSVEGELAAARNRLAAAVSEAYYRWLHALAYSSVVEHAFESAKTNEELGEARLNARTVLPSEVLRLKTQTAEARSDLLSAHTGVRKLQASLERLLARRIDSSEIPEPTFLTVSAASDSSSEDSGALVAKALQNRPEMESARSLIGAARDRVSAARGELLPRLSVSSQYRWDSEEFNKAADSWMVGLQASWPLFDGGLKLASLGEARAHLKEMEARGKEISLDIALEVSQAAQTVKEAEEKIRVAGEQRELAGKSLEETRHLYRNQVVAVDALLQAEVSAERAEASYMAALFDSKVSRALLRRALGDFAGSVGGEK